MIETDDFDNDEIDVEPYEGEPDFDGPQSTDFDVQDSVVDLPEGAPEDA